MSDRAVCEHGKLRWHCAPCLWSAMERIRDFMVDEEGHCTSCGSYVKPDGTGHKPTYRCWMAAEAIWGAPKP